MPGLTPEDREHLLSVIEKTPIIDHSASILLKTGSQGACPSGQIVIPSQPGLAHIRAVKQLSEALECDVTPEAITNTLSEYREYDEWARSCLQGIQRPFVLDDGGNDTDTIEHLECLRPEETRRVIDVEALVLRLLEEALAEGLEKETTRVETSDGEWAEVVIEPNDKAFRGALLEKFRNAVRGILIDSGVAGIEVPMFLPTTPIDQEITDLHDSIETRVARMFRESTEPSTFVSEYRQISIELLTYIFLKKTRSGSVPCKPIRFVTDAGDMAQSVSPLGLKTLMARFPKHKFVVRPDYTHVRDAACLASMCENVTVDVGGAVAHVSRSGQERIVKEVLETCPMSRVVWSAGGDHRQNDPETCFLAAKQARMALGAVVLEFVQGEDLTVDQAWVAANEILWRNCAKLYSLAFKPGKMVESRG